MKKSVFQICIATIALAVLAITGGGGCQLSLDDEDERESVELDSKDYKDFGTKVSGAWSSDGTEAENSIAPFTTVSKSTGLTLAFHINEALSDSDQYILFKSNDSDGLGMTDGYFSPWANSFTNGGTGVNDEDLGEVGIIKKSAVANAFYTIVLKSSGDVHFYINGEEIGSGWEATKTKDFVENFITKATSVGLILCQQGTGETVYTMDSFLYSSEMESTTVKQLYSKWSSYYKKNSATEVNAEKTLKSIAIAGYTTELYQNSEFTYGGTVTATFTDNSTADVTASATFSGYDMKTLGTQTVTVSYKHGEVTKTSTYTITVTVNNSAEKKELIESTAVSGVTTSTGLTLVFQTTGTVADDQLILFKGTSNSKTVTVRTGYLGDWAFWDAGINEITATAGTLKDGNCNVMKNGFTGNDGCAFVFKVDSDTTNSIYYYINGELALAWEKVTTTFCAALIDALSTNGLSFIDNSYSASSTLAMSGNVYYIASAVDSDTAKTLSAKPSSN